MVVIDRSGPNKAAIDEINAGIAVLIAVRQVRYLSNIVEQNHRATKRIIRPTLGFKSFRSGGNVLAGVELIHIIRKRQFAIDSAAVMSFSDQFYSSVEQVRMV